MSTPLLAGTKLGRYVIRSLIGAGGMGEVYLADDTLLRRPIAIKLLIGDYTLKEERLHRFEREAYAASSLNHPNIVTIYEIGSDNGHHFIATEYVDGRSLREHTFTRQMDWREIVEVAIQVASALNAAHEAGIIHRDIKPENIMLRPDGYVKVLDFGLAKLSDDTWTSNSDQDAATQIVIKTEPGRVMGTIDYMSPEQARGREVDPRSDLFSLGVVVYELATTVKPFSRETKSDTLAAVLTAEVAPMAQRRPAVPAELDRIVAKCLCKNRGERYQSAKELLVDLKNLRHELEVASKLGLPVSTAKVSLLTSPNPIAVNTPPRQLYPSTISELFIHEVKRHPRRSFAFFGVIGIALVIGVVGLYKLVKLATRTDSFQNMRVAKLTLSGDISQPAIAISPDGKYVVYSESAVGEETLWVKHVATSSTVKIIPAADVHYSGITFSPDGSYIYYASVASRQSSLSQIPVLGGPQRKLIDDADGPISFSPDGTRFVFRRNGNESQLLTAKVDGSDVQLVSTRQGGETWLAPAWSPSRHSIVAGVLSPANNRARLVEISLDDGKETSVATDEWLTITSVAWLADSSGLILTGRDVDTKFSQLWFVEYPGGKRRRITNDLESYVGVSLTADGNTLISIQIERVTNLWVAPNGDANLAKKITFEAGRDEGLSGLDCGPDGRLVYTVRLVAQADLWTSDPDGSNAKQLTFNAGRNFYPNITSDGRYIVFISDRNGRNQIWRVDVDGRNPRQLTNVEGISDRITLSPLDSSVFYPVYSEKLSTIWRVPIDGGSPVQVTRVDSLRPAISPDGKMLECEYRNTDENQSSKIATMSVTGESVQLYDFPKVVRSSLVFWNNDGTALIYREGRDRVDNLWSQKLAGGPPAQLTQFKTDQIFSFRWDYKRKEVVLARGRDGSDIVMFTNFR
ncbi:MAG TPA: protein kinase [Pyrinomonadaceae bacterium]